MTFLHFD